MVLSRLGCVRLEFVRLGSAGLCCADRLEWARLGLAEIGFVGSRLDLAGMDLAGVGPSLAWFS